MMKALRQTCVRYDEGLATDSHKTCVRLATDYSKDITLDLRVRLEKMQK